MLTSGLFTANLGRRSLGRLHDGWHRPPGKTGLGGSIVHGWGQAATLALVSEMTCRITTAATAVKVAVAAWAQPRQGPEGAVEVAIQPTGLRESAA